MCALFRRRTSRLPEAEEVLVLRSSVTAAGRYESETRSADHHAAGLRTRLCDRKRHWSAAFSRVSAGGLLDVTEEIAEIELSRRDHQMAQDHDGHDDQYPLYGNHFRDVRIGWRARARG